MFRAILNRIKVQIRDLIFLRPFDTRELKVLKLHFYEGEPLLKKIKLLNLNKQKIKILNKIYKLRKKLVQSNKLHSKKFDTILQNELKRDKLLNFSIFDYLLLYQILINFNLFYSAIFIRDTAIKKSIQYNGLLPLNFNLHIKSLIENKEWDKLERSLQKFSINKFIDKNLFNNAKVVGSIYNKKQFDSNSKTHINNHKDKYFGEFIKNKKVAIVGPAPSKLYLGEEIDEFDIVIRPSFFGVDKLYDSKIAGSKTHISYYNWRKTEFFLEKKNEILNEIDFACLKRSTENINDKRVRTPNLNSTFYFGEPNMIQIILYDIIPFRPKKIKLFFSNFYTTKTIYNSSYFNMTENKKYSFDTATMATHDIISQFNFVKNMYISDIIEADKETASVLSLKNENYIKRLVDIYHD